MLELRHLDVPHLRGRTTIARSGADNKSDDELEQEPTKRKRRAKEEGKLETVGSSKGNDSDEPNYMRAKHTRR